jgi:hypothetical protein
MMDVVDTATGKSKRQQVAEHLLEIATRWEVRVVGRDSDGELLKVASGNDSVNAAKLLFSYDVGKPQAAEEERALQLAEHLRSVARDQVDVGRTLLGKKLESMTEQEIATFWKLCDFGIARYLQEAQAHIAGTTDAREPEQIPASPPAEQPGAAQDSQPEAGTTTTDAPTEDIDGDS